MTTRSAWLAAGLAAMGIGLAGCPSDCALETPQVSTVQSSCSAPPGQQVSFPVTLCPACNQTAASCSPQLVGGTIFLDLKVEACSDGSSCPPPGCDVGPTVCSFAAPATPGTYQVIVPDGQGSQITRQLTVAVDATYSCGIASGFPATF